jgi:hypothetical protein
MATRAEKIAMINGIGTGEPNTAEEIRNILMELLDPTAGTIVMKDVSASYISSNFDATGLGVNEELGYARVNGNNGTRNWDGRVPIAYGGDFTEIGATGGIKDQIVVEHSHTMSQIRKYTDTFGTNGFYDRSNSYINAGLSTDSAGESGTNKNYQPYIVTLVTVKL